MKLTINNQKFYDELLLVIKLFFSANQIETENLNFEISYKLNNSVLTTFVNVSGNYLGNVINTNQTNTFSLTKNQLEKQDKFVKRYLKIELYNVLTNLTGKTMPWGSLTGIRPTKLFYELKHELGSSILAKN